MDEGSIEELRVYSLIKELEDRKYTEDELKKIFDFNCPLNQTRLYKYIRMRKRDMVSRLFTILKGELVTGDDIKEREPILRGKYKITAVIDGVRFTYVKENNK